MSLLLFYAPGVGPTPVAALNTNASLNVDTTYLIRIRVENSGLVGGTAFKWQYNHVGGGASDITTSSSNVRAVAATSFANDDDVTELIGGAGSYLNDNNAGSEDGTTALGANFPASGAVEFVLAFQLRSADVSNGQTGTIRLVQGDGTALDAYTNTFTYTVLVSGSNVSVTSGLGTLVVTGYAPTVSAAASVTLSPGTLVATGYEPAVSAAASVTLIPGALVAIGYEPTVSAAASVTLIPGTLAVVGYEPTVSATISISVEPVLGTLVVTGYAPTVAMGAIERIPPDAIISDTNLSGTVGNIDEDAASPDGSWLTADSAVLGTMLHVSFGSPGTEMFEVAYGADNVLHGGDNVVHTA